MLPAIFSQAKRCRLNEILRQKISNQVARFDKKFLQTTEVLGVEVVDFTGTEFETGLPVAPINLADFAVDDELIVETMLEPTIKLANSATALKAAEQLVSPAMFSQVQRYRLYETLRQKLDRSTTVGRFFIWRRRENCPQSWNAAITFER